MRGPGTGRFLKGSRQARLNIREVRLEALLMLERSCPCCASPIPEQVPALARKPEERQNSGLYTSLPLFRFTLECEEPGSLAARLANAWVA